MPFAAEVGRPRLLLAWIFAPTLFRLVALRMLTDWAWAVKHYPGGVAYHGADGELQVELAILQSNHEGALVDFLHAHIDIAQGALVNPAGLTQHGVPLHDAIKAMPFPTIEVHMSNIAAREAWRAHSIISPAVKATIQGLGPVSYLAALRALVDTLRATA